MSTFKSTAIVLVQDYTGTENHAAKADKNGNMPVAFRCLAGTMPNLGSVLSGTVSKSLQFKVGSRYLVSFEEGDTDPVHGRRITVKNMGLASIQDISDVTDVYGAARIEKIDAKAVAEKVFETADAEEKTNPF